MSDCSGANVRTHVVMPMRWLSGNSYKLDNWSPISMRIVLGLVLELLQKVAADGSVLLDPNLDIFKDPLSQTRDKSVGAAEASNEVSLVVSIHAEPGAASAPLALSTTPSTTEEAED